MRNYVQSVKQIWITLFPMEKPHNELEHNKALFELSHDALTYTSPARIHSTWGDTNFSARQPKCNYTRLYAWGDTGRSSVFFGSAAPNSWDSHLARICVRGVIKHAGAAVSGLGVSEPGEQSVKGARWSLSTPLGAADKSWRANRFLELK